MWTPTRCGGGRLARWGQSLLTPCVSLPTWEGPGQPHSPLPCPPGAQGKSANAPCGESGRCLAACPAWGGDSRTSSLPCEPCRLSADPSLPPRLALGPGLSGCVSASVPLCSGSLLSLPLPPETRASDPRTAGRGLGRQDRFHNKAGF